MSVRGVLLSILLLLSPISWSATSHTGEETLPAIVHSAELKARLQQALTAKGEDHQPRTLHLLADGAPRYTNRLIFEDSPYLLQHAHNPVNWYPWGEEALAAARRENKPIFLSIGYSTCHWCHVMEEESFDNPAIARLLNEHFIAIKVDREQRPDLDATYMAAVMLITQQGGWPMSSFLTPRGKPFYGGTYFPPEAFTGLLERVTAAWSEQESELREQGDRIAAAVAERSARRGAARKLSSSAIDAAVMAAMARYDELQGGFSQAPKFPNETILLLLLQHVERFGDLTVLEALMHTLDAMAQGGIYDQVGGGFARYSVDNEWLVPHFEKMLYNQALLARVYLKAWRLSGEPRFARIARETLDYVLRDMRAAEGGFYSATDADSEGEEGTFFLWSPEQLHAALPTRLAERAIDLYGVTDEGNFEGGNILHLPESLGDYATRHGLEPKELRREVDRIRQRLYQAREQRIHPLRDEKIVTAWNGMLITSLALAGDALAEPRYLKAAVGAAEFLWRHNRRDDGGLWRTHLRGRSSVAASQQDYAYLGEALVTLHDVTGEARWLERAKEVTREMLKRFWDTETSGLFMSEASAAIAGMGRLKEIEDRAIPSGNGVAARLLGMLAARTGERLFDERADEQLAAFAGTIERLPIGYTYTLLAADERLRGALGRHRYAARGTVAVKATIVDGEENGKELRLDLRIRPGWHINAHRPLQESLIATELSLADGAGGWRLGEISYPPPLVRRLGFSREPLALYEGEVRLSAKLIGGGTLVPIKLRLQACSDKVCLAPETLVFRLADHR